VNDPDVSLDPADVTGVPDIKLRKGSQAADAI
jgi:hypothetical protein